MISGTVLRKKWKYLRDQFSVECSKVKQPRSGDAAETTTEPKWPYFKQLQFLKDIVRPRVSSSNLKPTAATVTNVAGEDDASLVDDEQEILIDLNVPEVENVEIEPHPDEQQQPHNIPTIQPRKRKRLTATNTLYNEKILQLEQEKINTLQSVFNREPDNDDIMFFKSLMPFVSKIPIERKLTFRSRIQQVVEEFAFFERHWERPSPPISTSCATTMPSPALSTTSYDAPVDNYHALLPISGGVFPQTQDGFPRSSGFSQNQNL